MLEYHCFPFEMIKYNQALVFFPPWYFVTMNFIILRYGNYGKTNT